MDTIRAKKFGRELDAFCHLSIFYEMLRGNYVAVDTIVDSNDFIQRLSQAPSKIFLLSVNKSGAL